MLGIVEADLHIHTCLSPCGDLLLSPRAAVAAARERGIGLIAVCDHNSAANVGAALRASRGTGVTVIPGLEATSSEEVHLLTIFPDEGRALEMQRQVHEHLLPGRNDAGLFGEQVIVNERDEVEGFDDRLLIGATSLSLEALVEATHLLGGLAIASHVDREAFGLIGQLGMVPEGLALDAVEISRNADPKTSRVLLPGCERFPVIQSSDAHRVDEIGSATTRFRLEAPTFDELRMALRAEGGRGIVEPGLS